MAVGSDGHVAGTAARVYRRRRGPRDTVVSAGRMVDVLPVVPNDVRGTTPVDGDPRAIVVLFPRQRGPPPRAPDVVTDADGDPTAAPRIPSLAGTVEAQAGVVDRA